MNKHSNDTPSRKRGGGQPHNTNGLRHGWFATTTEQGGTADQSAILLLIAAAVDRAVEERDVPTLKRAERAYKFHRQPQRERMTRAVRALIEHDAGKEGDLPHEPAIVSAPGSASRDRRLGPEPVSDLDDWPDSDSATGFSDDLPEPDTPFFDDTRQDLDTWHRTYHPTLEQQPLLTSSDMPVEEFSIFTGRRTARGTTGHRTGGQDDFPSRRH